MLPGGRKVERQRTASVAVRRPDRVQAWSRNDRGGRGVWYDGRSFTLYDVRSNHYGTVPAPSTIDDLADALEGRYGIHLPLADLIVGDGYVGLTAGVRKGDYLGRQSVNGVRCHHLAYVQDNVDWEIWVEDGHVPAVRRLKINYKTVEGAPTFVATLTDWKFETDLPDYAFAFRPPTGATRIQVLPSSQMPTDANDENVRPARASPITQP